MDIRKITDSLSVSPQISADDLKALADQGFRSIICNRPDGEAGDQPSYRVIAAAARDAGLEARYLPVVPGQIGPEDISGFTAALNEMQGPVLAYCRTGTRSATLWSLAQAGRLSVDEILSATRTAGYDMSGIAGRLSGAPSMPAVQQGG